MRCEKTIDIEEAIAMAKNPEDAAISEIAAIIEQQSQEYYKKKFVDKDNKAVESPLPLQQAEAIWEHLKQRGRVYVR
jgi:hypothetical protein